MIIRSWLDEVMTSQYLGRSRSDLQSDGDGGWLYKAIEEGVSENIFFNLCGLWRCPEEIN